MIKDTMSTVLLRLGSLYLSRQVPNKLCLKSLIRVTSSIGNFRQLSDQCYDSLQNNSSNPKYMVASDSLLHEEYSTLCKDMVVLENFLSEAEENQLFQELEPYMARLHYEYDHWDNAIHGFRETERLHWTKPNMDVLARVRKTAFPEGKPQLKYVHVLDLSAEGYIKPHIDSVKFCGDTIAGLSLLSDSVMRLVHEEKKHKFADVLLQRRSLYLMRDSARYHYTHEILKKDVSKFKNAIVPRGRRISVICRSEI